MQTPSLCDPAAAEVERWGITVCDVYIDAFCESRDMVDVQVALHPIDTEAGPTLGRLSSLHRRRKSGSGSGALMEGGRADAEAATAEASSQSSRSLMHKYD